MNIKKFLNEIKKFYSFEYFFSYRKNKDFSIELLLINILLIAISRGLFDELWLGEFNYIENVYVWSVLLCIYVVTFPVSVDYIIRKLYKINYDKNRLLQFFVFSSKIWWLVVFVSLTNWILKWNLNLVKIEYFEKIPSFMINGNYLPIGMILVIPFLIIFSVEFVHRNYKLPYYKSFFPSFTGLLIIYLLFYQWLWQLFYLFFLITSSAGNGFKISWLTGIMPYLLVGLLYLTIFIPSAYKTLGKYKISYYYTFIIANVLFMIFCPKIGILYFFMFYV